VQTIGNVHRDTTGKARREPATARNQLPLQLRDRAAMHVLHGQVVRALELAERLHVHHVGVLDT
jgi:hypothetical protein